MKPGPVKGKPLKDWAMRNQNQGPRNERATIAVTATEKQALRVLSAVRQTSEGELLRTMLLDDIVAECSRTIERMRQGEAA